MWVTDEVTGESHVYRPGLMGMWDAWSTLCCFKLRYNKQTPGIKDDAKMCEKCKRQVVRVLGPQFDELMSNR